MNIDNAEEVVSEYLGEGYIIISDDGSLSPVIEWVDWVQLSDEENDMKIEVHFIDETVMIFPTGYKLRQIWHKEV